MPDNRRFLLGESKYTFWAYEQSAVIYELTGARMIFGVDFFEIVYGNPSISIELGCYEASETPIRCEFKDLLIIITEPISKTSYPPYGQFIVSALLKPEGEAIKNLFSL